MILRSKMVLLASALLPASFLFLTSPVLAAQQWTGSRQITQLYPNSYGLIFYVGGSDLRASNPCPGNRLFIAETAPNYEVLASSIILAFGSSYTVNVSYEDTTLSNCDIIINRVTINKP